MRKLISSLLAALPTIHVGMDDWYLHVAVGEEPSRSVGFTVGPHFLSLDYNGDIARQIVSPPEDYEAPMCDISFSWDSRKGLSYLNVPAYTYNRHPFPWDNVCDEELEPSTIRFTRTPTYIDEQRDIAGEEVYGIHY